MARSQEYKLGWRYIVWVGGCDDYYKSNDYGDGE